MTAPKPLARFSRMPSTKPSNSSKTPSALNTRWPNPSLSSVNSFHSAITNMELNQLSPPLPQSSDWTSHPATEQRGPSPQQPQSMEPEPSLKLESTKMGRQDSGYSDGVRSRTSSRPTSSSSARHSKSKSSSSSRPSTRRAPRSSHPTTHGRSTVPIQRPPVRTHHTTPGAPSTPHQFFQFPTLQDPAQSPEPAPQSPPPATMHYWTSDSTRRLEYAAIDAANRGVRGFLIKLVPDCIIAPAARRTRFHNDADSDDGSVRRYRLVLPEEKASSDPGDGATEGARETRRGILGRWTLGFGKKRN